MAAFACHILFIDAYDSFSENIIALLRQLLNATVTTIKIDDTSLSKSDVSNSEHLLLSSCTAIVIGPGPGSPDSATDTGILNDLWDHASSYSIPVLGVCLGFQSLCRRYGLTVTELDLPCHGHTQHIFHCGSDIFHDVGYVVATCYNSLAVHGSQLEVHPSDASSALSSTEVSRSHTPTSTSTSDSDDFPLHDFQPSSERKLQPLAWNRDGYLMAVKHKNLPFWGLQFHPESCLSNVACQQAIQNWYEQVKIHNKTRRPPRELSVASSANEEAHVIADVDPKIEKLRSFLTTLTSDCGRQVASHTIDSTCSRQEIRDLCQASRTSSSSAMLESSRRGRYSIYAILDEKTWILQYANNICEILRTGERQFSADLDATSTMLAVEEFLSSKISSGGNADVPFWGGLIASISYEAGLDMTIPQSQRHPPMDEGRRVPELSLVWVDRSVVYDNMTSRIHIQSFRTDDEGWLNTMTAQISSIGTKPGIANSIENPTKPSSHLPECDNYVSRIRAGQKYLQAGNSYELCLTTEAIVTTTHAPYDIYSSLQAKNPAPYSAYLSLGETTILSSSPEQFLSWSRSSPHLEMMPMKGTVARSAGVDFAQARSILRTPKEEAENLMIADLIRHDLHRSLAPSGKVEVKTLYEVVETENTYQLISHIRGHMPLTFKNPSSLVERTQQILHYGHKALRTSLPPGSMTGAPKIRSCSILAEIEQRNRGIYSGVIGYFDIGGGGCWSVAIRCAFSSSTEDEIIDSRCARKWHIGSGGAITVLSDEESEWQEMKVKMDGVLAGFAVKEG